MSVAREQARELSGSIYMFAPISDDRSFHVLGATASCLPYGPTLKAILFRFLGADRALKRGASSSISGRAILAGTLPHACPTALTASTFPSDVSRTPRILDH